MICPRTTIASGGKWAQISKWPLGPRKSSETIGGCPIFYDGQHFTTLDLWFPNLTKLILTSLYIFQEKSATIVKLRSEVSQLQEDNSDLKIRQDDLRLKFDEAKLDLENKNSVVQTMQRSISDLRSRSEREQDRLECEVKLLLENFENVKRDRNSAKLELEVKEAELESYKERVCQLEKYNRENGAKILQLETRNKNLVNDFKAKQDEMERISEMLEIAGKDKICYIDGVYTKIFSIELMDKGW